MKSRIYDIVIESASFGSIQLANVLKQQGYDVLALYQKPSLAYYSVPLFSDTGSPLTVVWNGAKILFYEKYVANDIARIPNGDNLIRFLHILEKEYEKFPPLQDTFTYEAFVKNKISKLPDNTDKLYEAYKLNYFFRVLLDSIVMFFTGTVPPFPTDSYIRTLFMVLKGVSSKTVNDLTLITDSAGEFEKIYDEVILKSRDEGSNVKLELSYYEQFVRAKQVVIDKVDGFLPFSFVVDAEQKYIPSGIGEYTIYIASNGYEPVAIDKIWFIRYLKDTGKFIFTTFGTNIVKDRNNLKQLVLNVIPTLGIGALSVNIPDGLRYSDRVMNNVRRAFVSKYNGKLVYAGRTSYGVLGSGGDIFFPNYMLTHSMRLESLNVRDTRKST